MNSRTDESLTDKTKEMMELTEWKETVAADGGSISIEIPHEVAFIINRLQEHGYEAYAVGGCVRDALLGRVPHDWDITTSAKPMEVKALFKKTIDTGLQHGTVTIMENHEGFEVTTYRIDGEYEDGRHPKEVAFTADLSEDLRRRDFTINAMAYSPSTGVVDLFGGRQDLKDGVIRCVGSAMERFTEDALRIMRAVRFAAQLGFRIEQETWDAIGVLAPNLKKISAERIQAELVKLLESANPGHFRKLYESGITKVIMPEFDRAMDCEQNSPYHVYSVGEHTLRVLEYLADPAVVEKVDEILPLRLAAIFHDLGKPLAKTTDETGRDHFKGHPEISEKIAFDILKRLKFDNKTLDRTLVLVKYHDYRIVPSAPAVRRAMNKVGVDIFSDFLWIQMADASAKHPDQIAGDWQAIEELREIYKDILLKKEAVTLKDLAVNGKDLIKAGVAPGPGLGEVLNRIFEHVLEHPEHNVAEVLLDKFVKKQDS